MDSRFTPEPYRQKQPRPEGEHLPRKADVLRGSIARLTSANADRHDAAEAERTAVRARMVYDRRRRLLVRHIARWLAFTVDDLDRLLSGLTVRSLHAAMTSRQHLECARCRYSLRGLGPVGNCPECGAPYRTGQVSLDIVAEIVAEALDLPREQVDHDFCVEQAILAEMSRM